MAKIDFIPLSDSVIVSVSELDPKHKTPRIVSFSVGDKCVKSEIPPFSDRFITSISGLEPSTNYAADFSILSADLKQIYLTKKVDVETMANRFRGIDISENNGLIDWPRVSGVDFVIVRAGYGRNNIDQEAVRNCNGVQSRGFSMGLYWFSYAYTVEMARNEGQYAAAFAHSYNIDLPIFFDFEYASIEYAESKGVTVTPALLRDMTTAFCGAVESAGYESGVYTNPDLIIRYYGADYISNKILWLAQWQATEPALYDWAVWQYGITHISGISGDVDGDILRGYIPRKIKKSNFWVYLKKFI